MRNDDLSRRELLRWGGAAAVGLGLTFPAGAAGATPHKRVAQNDKILLGVIGCGSMGNANMDGFMGHPEVEVVACCDVDSNHLNATAAKVEQKQGKAPKKYKDYRALLDMKEINAVLISTPDHWHALPTIHACEAGKDVYVEKPIAHNIVEGRAMVNAAKKYRRVIQVGTWQRSVQHFVDAIDYVRAGKLGKVTIVRSWTLGHAGQGKASPQNPPPNLDWNLWLGPAPMVPYRPNRCHGAFRWFFDYAAGLTGDWGVHMLDIALLGMNATAPRKVASYGGKLVCGPNDDRDTPDTQIALFEFPGWVLHWEIYVGAPGVGGRGHHGTEFIGTKGSLIVDRDGWRVTGKGLRTEASARKVGDHIGDFLACMKSRQTPRSGIESMHYTTTLCHLANLAYLTGRALVWDGKQEVVVGDKEAMSPKYRVYQREYRKPYKLPMHRA
jgi:predicted dehydrogenase